MVRVPYYGPCVIPSTLLPRLDVHPSRRGPETSRSPLPIPHPSSSASTREQSVLVGVNRWLSPDFIRTPSSWDSEVPPLPSSHPSPLPYNSGRRSTDRR